MAELIKLGDYARRLGKRPETANMRAQRGAFKTAVKVGSRWYIDPDEPWVDNRVCDGYYAGVHQKYYKPKGTKSDENT